MAAGAQNLRGSSAVDECVELHYKQSCGKKKAHSLIIARALLVRLRFLGDLTGVAEERGVPS